MNFSILGYCGLIGEDLPFQKLAISFTFVCSFELVWLFSLSKVLGSKIGALCFSITAVVIDVGIFSKSIFSEMYAPLAT